MMENMTALMNAYLKLAAKHGYTKDETRMALLDIFSAKELKEDFNLAYLFEDLRWRDIVLINGQCYAECFPISGEMDDDCHYWLDDFYTAVAQKHGVEVDDIQTYVIDKIKFDPAQMPWGAEKCGAVDTDPLGNEVML